MTLSALSPVGEAVNAAEMVPGTRYRWTTRDSQYDQQMIEATFEAYEIVDGQPLARFVETENLFRPVIRHPAGTRLVPLADLIRRQVRPVEVEAFTLATEPTGARTTTGLPLYRVTCTAHGVLREAARPGDADTTAVYHAQSHRKPQEA